MNIKRNRIRCCSGGLILLAAAVSPGPLAGQNFITNNLSPVADAYVQNGNNAGVNFGSVNDLEVQANSVAQLNYDSFLRFSLSTVSNLSGAKLRIRARLGGAGTVATTLYATTTNWVESSITWNNKPSRGTSLGSVNISGGSYTWYELDVSSFLISEKSAGRNLVAFCLHNNNSSSQDIEINSREAASANRPVLVCVANNIAPSVVLTKPANNAVFVAPANITISANASDSDNSVAQVSFYRGTTLLGTDTSAPYSFSWSNVSPGSYSLTARARDNWGLEKTSVPVNVTVNANVAPTVNMASPANGAAFTSPANVTLSANAVDADGAVTQVQFYDGSTLLNTDSASPYSFLWNNVPAGTHSLKVRATDNLGASSTSSVVTMTIHLRPTVSLTAPTSGAVFTYPGPVTLNATASDADGIAKVEFYDGTTLLNSDTAAPYSYVWNGGARGNHSLTAWAYDNRGATATSSIVNVIINLRPTVSLTTPANGAVFTAPADVFLSADATDDGSVVRVEFYDGPTLLNTDPTPAFSYLFSNVPAGAHPFTARAYDNRGVSTTSSVATVNLDLPPMVSLTAPADGTILISPAALTLSATASDSDGSITQVQFYDGPTLLGTSTVSPYSYVWNNVPTGDHSLTARAFDNLGIGRTSSIVNVTVAASAPPAVNITSPADGAIFYLYSDVTITADVPAPNGNISQVRFMVDGLNLGIDTDSPYSILWSPSPGTHILTAEVTDNNGASSVSPPVTVEILPLDRDPGLTGYWKFEEGTGATAHDSSGRGNEGVVNSSSWPEGKVGNSALEVGPSMGMSVPNPGNTILPPSGRPFSLSLWIKPTDLNLLPTAQTFLMGNALNQTGWRFGVIGGGNGPQFRFWSDGGNLDLTTPAPLTLNIWSMLALTFNDDVATIYLDGIKLGSAVGHITGNTAPLRFGNNDSLLPGGPAQLDDLKIYNREVAPAEFGLTGHWTFEEGQGSGASDTSGHDNNAGLLSPIWTTGRIGNRAVQFNGGYGWFGNVHNQALPETGQAFSISLWFSPQSLPAGQCVLMGAEQAAVSGWRLGVNTVGLGTNDLCFSSTNSAGTLVVSGRSVLVLGRWYKVTLTYSGTEAKLYLDGQLLGSGTGTIIGNALPVVFAGGISGVPGLPVKLDDLKTYNRELSREELSLEGHWRFDERSGYSAGDSSGNGHHAQVSVGNWTDGKLGFGSLNLPANLVIVSNQNYAALPPTGGPFSLSMWLYPYDLPVGYSGLLASSTSSAQGTNGWQLTCYKDANGTNAIRLSSLAFGGTLDLWAPANALTISAWTKLDVTFNGGVATIYLNGRRVNSDSGGIIASTGPLQMGGLAGLSDFNGAIDEVKLFNRSLEEPEIGPVARVMWETVWMNTPTNMTLSGVVPSGKTATYSLVSQATNGIAAVSATGTLTYTPNPNYKGPDALTYMVNDGEFSTTPTVVVLSVVKVRYLSPSGGAIPPLDGTSPDHAQVAFPFAVLDQIYKTNQYYDCFYYLPGTYETMGWKYGERKTANPGCKHIGSGREGPNATILKLVNIWHSNGEESIFASYWYLASPDGFEVRDMVLDCNAANNPKYTVGEPISITAPFSSARTVDRIKLFWNTASLPNAGTYYVPGHAQEYTIFAKDPASGQINPIYVANNGPGGVEDIAITPPISTTQIQIRLTRRGTGVAFYSLRELQIFAGGANIALGLPVTATNLFGSPSVLQWDAVYSADRMVDGDEVTSWTSASQGMCGAISVGGNNLKFINLKVIGFGTKAWRECFPFYVAVGSALLPQADFGNILFDNCEVTDPATHNTDGCTAVVLTRLPPFTLTNQMIRNCQVSNLKPYFDYSHAFSSTRLENCRADNTYSGVYFEPDPYVRDAGPTLIQSNRFVNVLSGILVGFHPDIQFSSITAIGNEFVMANEGFLSLAAYDSGTSSITNVTALNNVVRFDDRINQLGTSRAFHASNIRNALFGNNTIVSGIAGDLRVGYGFDILPLNYRRVWFNNRDLDGNLLPITYFNGSAVVPASQQQFP